MVSYLLFCGKECNYILLTKLFKNGFGNVELVIFSLACFCTMVNDILLLKNVIYFIPISNIKFYKTIILSVWVCACIAVITAISTISRTEAPI